MFIDIVQSLFFLFNYPIKIDNILIFDRAIKRFKRGISLTKARDYVCVAGLGLGATGNTTFGGASTGPQSSFG